MATLEETVVAWARAERDGDAAALDALLHPDFRGVGPFGFLLDRAQWIARFADGLHYREFAFTLDAEPRLIDATAIVIGTQTQRGAYRDQPADAAFRGTLVFADPARWRLAGVHLSPRTPPAPPTRPPGSGDGGGSDGSERPAGPGR